MGGVGPRGDLLALSEAAIAPSITRQCDRNESTLKKQWGEDPKGAAKASLAFLSRSVWGEVLVE
jgi:hypothetical protein